MKVKYFLTVQLVEKHSIRKQICINTWEQYTDIKNHSLVPLVNKSSVWRNNWWDTLFMATNRTTVQFVEKHSDRKKHLNAHITTVHESQKPSVQKKSWISTWLLFMRVKNLMIVQLVEKHSVWRNFWINTGFLFMVKNRLIVQLVEKHSFASPVR